MGCGASTNQLKTVTNPSSKSSGLSKVTSSDQAAKGAPVDTPSIHYKVGNLIGEGAYGKVFECLNIESGEILAVKHVDLSGDKNTVVREITSLKQEISLLRGLKHKNIVKYITTQVSDDMKSVDIIMEYVPGGSVRQLLNRFQKLHEKTVQKYTLQILQGLEYLHSKGIIHRDIKCANLLVDNEGIVKLSDFGASKYIEDRIEMNRSLKGSPYWIAPEVALRTGHSCAADIWSVGCVLIEMLTGNPPWSNISKNSKEVLKIVANTKYPPQLPSGVSPSCTEFMDMCLKIDYRLRPTINQLLTTRFITEEIIYVPENELQAIDPYDEVYNIEDIPMTVYK